MGVVNPKNLCIPVWVSAGTSFRRPEHNIGMNTGVNRITITTDVICCVVDGKLFGRKHGVVDKSNRVPFFIREKAGIVTVKAFVKEPAEEMDMEFVNKILEIG
jgi:hypothetical protein